MNKLNWHLQFTNLWKDFINNGIGIVILGIHFYKDEIGIILFNFTIGIEKY
jgi:hypothetical protein